jgi:hypothetical protein
VTGRSDHVLIRRTGREALRLTGYGLAAQTSSRTTSGPRQNRWHELEWWSHDAALSGPEQRHCLVVRYCTQWQGELGHDDARILLRRDLERVLREIDPCAHVTGYPVGEHYVEKQRRLLADIRAGYEHAVSDLLAAARVWELGDGP